MWAGGKGSCAVCIDPQAVGVLEVIFLAHFLGELGWALEKGRVLFSSNHHLYRLPLGVDKPLTVVSGHTS